MHQLGVHPIDNAIGNSCKSNHITQMYVHCSVVLNANKNDTQFYGS
jgi:hypothetical protein